MSATRSHVPQRRLASIASVADYTDTSTKTVRRRIADGTFTAYRMGRLIRLDLGEVDSALRQIPTAGSAA